MTQHFSVYNFSMLTKHDSKLHKAPEYTPAQQTKHVSLKYQVPILDQQCETEAKDIELLLQKPKIIPDTCEVRSSKIFDMKRKHWTRSSDTFPYDLFCRWFRHSSNLNHYNAWSTAHATSRILEFFAGYYFSIVAASLIFSFLGCGEPSSFFLLSIIYFTLVELQIGRLTLNINQMDQSTVSGLQGTILFLWIFHYFSRSAISILRFLEYPCFQSPFIRLFQNNTSALLYIL